MFYVNHEYVNNAKYVLNVSNFDKRILQSLHLTLNRSSMKLFKPSMEIFERLSVVNCQ